MSAGVLIRTLSGALLLYLDPSVERVDVSPHLEKHLLSEEGEATITKDPHTQRHSQGLFVIFHLNR